MERCNKQVHKKKCAPRFGDQSKKKKEKQMEAIEAYLPRWRHVALECLGIFFLLFYIFVGYYILLTSIHLLDLALINTVEAWHFGLTMLRNWVCKC